MNIDYSRLQAYWDDIPTDKENAVTYGDLMQMWNISAARIVRTLLHELSKFDNGDDYVLIRSSRYKGFYKTDNIAEIREYKQECLNKGRSMFAPIKKINRIISGNSEQYSIQNNMRLIREEKGLTQADVYEQMNIFDTAIDKSMLSKFENGVCLPTPYQLLLLARIFDCEPYEILNGDLYY